MPATLVPINEASSRLLSELAAQTGYEPADVLARSLEEYRRKLFLDSVNAGYAAMRDDPKAWADEVRERSEWDAVLPDGLDGAERWTEDGQCLSAEPPEATHE